MDKGLPWDRLLKVVKVTGRPEPLSEVQLTAFEAENKVNLPHSYREFCKVLGPGSLRGRIWVHISAPGVKVASEQSVADQMKVNIDVLNKEVWTRDFFELDEYCSNPALVRQGLLFGRDIYTHNYFWSKTEITDKRRNEMAVYVIYREMQIHRLADSFESFIYDICLDKGIPDQGKLDYDPPIFEAVSTQ